METASKLPPDNRQDARQEQEDGSSTTQLLFPQDKDLLSDYLFLMLQQMQPCNLTETDRDGHYHYKSRPIGFPGLACRHCVGREACKAGNGRFFPATEELFCQQVTCRPIINHVENKCMYVPTIIRERLKRAQREPPVKMGSYANFFRTLWCRLQKSTHPLVIPQDEGLVSDHMYLTFKQLQPCNLTEADRTQNHHYKHKTIGFPGLVCQHCVGTAACKAGKGRFFPASLDVLYALYTCSSIVKHVESCSHVPSEIRDCLKRARHGARKSPELRVFLRRVWSRLHKVPLDDENLTLAPKRRRKKSINEANKTESHGRHVQDATLMTRQSLRRDAQDNSSGTSPPDPILFAPPPSAAPVPSTWKKVGSLRLINTQALIAVADGSESVDVITCSKVLKAFGMNTVLAGVSPDTKKSYQLRGGVSCHADMDFVQAQRKSPFRVVFLPGGHAGVKQLMESESFVNFLQDHVTKLGGLVAAMGASATSLLERLGFVDRIGPTCWPVKSCCPMIVKERQGQVWTCRGQDENVCVQLALALGERFYGTQRAQEVSKEFLVSGRSSSSIQESGSSTAVKEIVATEDSETVARSQAKPYEKEPSETVRDASTAPMPSIDKPAAHEKRALHLEDSACATPERKRPEDISQQDLLHTQEKESGGQARLAKPQSPFVPLAKNQYAAALFWKFLWRPLTKLGWTLKTVDGKHHYLSPNAEYTNAARGHQWFRSRKGVIRYLEEKESDNKTYRELLGQFQEEDEKVERNAEECKELLEAYNEQNRLKGRPTIQTGNGVPKQKKTTTDELFSHIVWPRLCKLGWPEADQARALEKPSEILDKLWNDPEWCLRMDILCTLDLYETAKGVKRKMRGASPDEIESEAKRRKPALSTY